MRDVDILLFNCMYLIVLICIGNLKKKKKKKRYKAFYEVKGWGMPQGDSLLTRGP